MTQWRFVGGVEAGASWLAQPSRSMAAILFSSGSDTHPREELQLSVATKAWIEAQLAGFDSGELKVRDILFPAMLVLPNLTGEKLQDAITQAVMSGGLVHFARRGG